MPLTSQQLTLINNSLKKQKAYAWAKFYQSETRHQVANAIRYRIMNSVVETIPTHIRDEYIKMCEETKKEISCPICMDVIEYENLFLSSCGHKYCKACYIQYINHLKSTNKPLKCAVCKRKVKAIE